NSLLDGKPKGKAVISLGGPPAPVTIYVALPPSGNHHNLDRYPIAIVGGDYRGLLLSSSTHVPGLVSIADVAPTVRSLEQGEKPNLTSRSARDAPAPLAVAARTRGLVALALAALLGTYAVFLGAWSATVSLAALGPHPEGGGRFFGLTNQVETLLLAPALALGALVQLPLLPGVALA